MVRSVLALSLLGLSAVNALPTKAVEERQTWIIGGGEGSFGSGSSDCQLGVPSEQQGACVYQPITGGLNPPPKSKRADDSKQVLRQLEQDLVKLQNKENKTEADKQKIKALQKAINRLAGIIAISAPGGSSVTFTPGKRDLVTFDPIGAFASECPRDVRGVQNALLKLLTISRPTLDEFLAIQRLTHILGGCGYTIADDGATFFKISDKRAAAVAPFDISGLQTAYTDALQALNGAKPSFSTWLVLQSVADQLEYYGVSVDRSAGYGSVSLIPRQSGGEFKLGCLPSDLLALTVFWNALSSQFGRNPRQWPKDIYWHFYSVLETLKACGIDVGELTPQPTIPGGPMTPDPTIPGGPLKPDPSNPGGGLKPDPYVPGGALVPEPSVPGGAMKPDPTTPGGSLTPDPTTPGGAMNPPKMKRDSKVMLEALEILEKAYGTPAAGTIPGAIRPTMDTIVADLQGSGVVVIGWPTTRFGISP